MNDYGETNDLERCIVLRTRAGGGTSSSNTHNNNSSNGGANGEYGKRNNHNNQSSNNNTPCASPSSASISSTSKTSKTTTARMSQLSPSSTTAGTGTTTATRRRKTTRRTNFFVFPDHQKSWMLYFTISIIALQFILTLYSFQQHLSEQKELKEKEDTNHRLVSSIQQEWATNFHQMKTQQEALQQQQNQMQQSQKELQNKYELQQQKYEKQVIDQQQQRENDRQTFLSQMKRQQQQQQRRQQLHKTNNGTQEVNDNHNHNHHPLSYIPDDNFIPFTIRDAQRLVATQVPYGMEIFEYIDITQSTQTNAEHSKLYHNGLYAIGDVPCVKYSVTCYKQKILQVFHHLLNTTDAQYYFYMESDNDLCVPLSEIRSLAYDEGRYFISTGVGFSGWIMNRTFVSDFVEYYENFNEKRDVKDYPDIVASFMLIKNRNWAVTRRYLVSHTIIQSVGASPLTVGKNKKTEKHLPRCFEPKRGIWSTPESPKDDMYGWDYFDYEACPYATVFPCGPDQLPIPKVEDVTKRAANGTDSNETLPILQHGGILQERIQQLRQAAQGAAAAEGREGGVEGGGGGKNIDHPPNLPRLIGRRELDDETGAVGDRFRGRQNGMLRDYDGRDGRHQMMLRMRHGIF